MVKNVSISLSIENQKKVICVKFYGPQKTNVDIEHGTKQICFVTKVTQRYNLTNLTSFCFMIASLNTVI